MYSKGFNNCYILLSNISQAFENTKFGAGELSLIVSLVLYRPPVFTNSDKGKYKGKKLITHYSTK